MLRWAHTWPHQARDGLFDRNPYASTNKEGGEKHNTGSHDVGLANDLLAGPPQRMYVAARGAVATDPHPGAAYRGKMCETSPDIILRATPRLNKKPAGDNIFIAMPSSWLGTLSECDGDGENTKTMRRGECAARPGETTWGTSHTRNVPCDLDLHSLGSKAQ